ncbi:hypothetical protein [Phenylobacterium aquaticum]|uniref:hypothetical protein n=1 Tax=Phenylobacterium aquaticum TaxID=1763816 RepID=UPI001F5CBFCF|nr:hypothetical protein [Phenylobacterium aquaticum]MCI3133036.1 hypothetical protein [Phenylobacterium aquaticum]
MGDDAGRWRQGETARNLALVNYGLLFAAIFFAGVPALIAVIIAYVQRDEAPARIRSHHTFQIRIFWVAFALTLAAGVCFVTALVSGLSELIAAGGVHGWSQDHSYNIEMAHMSLDGRVIGLVVAGVILSILTGLWLVAAPAIGFIRLASERGIGDSAA